MKCFAEFAQKSAKWATSQRKIHYKCFDPWWPSLCYQKSKMDPDSVEQFLEKKSMY